MDEGKNTSLRNLNESDKPEARFSLVSRNGRILERSLFLLSHGFGVTGVVFTNEFQKM